MKKITNLRPMDLNCNIFSCYDYDGYSLQELLCQFFTKIDECVDLSNNSFELADWLVNEGLKQEVAEKLEEMLKNDELSEAVNNVLKLVETYPVLSCETGVKDKRYKYGDIRRFGAIEGYNNGNQKVQQANNEAFKNAIISAGNPWDTCSHEVYVPVGAWYYNLPIKILKNNITFKGSGIEQTILCPQGCNGIETYDFPDVPHGVRRYGVNIKDFCISGDRNVPIALDVSGMTLECKVENVKVERSVKGIYGFGCFDFKVENVHIRECVKEGIHIEHPVGPAFKEVSYINFDWCNATECNIEAKGPAWKLSGNNFYLTNCKAVGYHGVEFYGQSMNCVVQNFYFDGKRYSGGEPGTEEVFPECSVIRLNDYNIRNISLENIYGWNFGVSVDIINATSASVSNLNPNSGNWDFTAVKLGHAFNGTLNLDNRQYKIVDNRQHKRTYKLIYASSAGQPFTYEVIDKEFNMYRGADHYDIEYAGQANQGLVAVYYMPAEDLHYKARSGPMAGQKMPATMSGSTNGQGYGVVTIHCPHVNDDEARTVKGKMILVRLNKNNLITPQQPYNMD